MVAQQLLVQQSKTAPWDDQEPATQAPVQRTAAAKAAPAKVLEPAFDDDDENMDFFKRLAEED
jgi:hypothetical protein